MAGDVAGRKVLSVQYSTPTNNGQEIGETGRDGKALLVREEKARRRDVM